MINKEKGKNWLVLPFSFFLFPFSFQPALLLALGAALFLYRLGDRELTASHEARAAQNARTILTDGNWGLPRLLDRHVELQKPPLYYWLVALVAWLRDGQVDGWSVRLPSALSALACLMIVYGMGALCGRGRAGFLAAVMLGTSLHFTWLGRVGRIDMPLTFTTTLVMAGFYLGWRRLGEQRRAWPWLVVAYVALGLGLLLKGPIAAVLPAAGAGCFFVVEHVRSRRAVADVRNDKPGPGLLLPSLLWGMPLALAIAAPWYIWANLKTDNQLWNVFFWHHNVERGFGSSVLASHPVWFYLPRLGVDLLPWVLAAPLAGWYFFSQRRWHSEPEARFGLCWFLGVLSILSLMRFKRADYLTPAYPGLAIWLGFLTDRWFAERSTDAPFRLPQSFVSPRSVGMIAAACLTAWLGYVQFVEPARERARPYRQFAEEIRRRTARPVIFFRAEAHELAFHVGPPLDTILEWENLDVWASLPETTYFVMPADCARDWQGKLKQGRLVEVMASTDLVECNRERPLKLMRSIPRSRQNP